MNKDILINEIHTENWKKELEINNLTYNYLHYTDIYMYQRKDMFRNNTDTALLGMFLKVKRNESLLDIGTNNGALLLYASKQQPKSLTGIDILEEACNLASFNMIFNHVDATIECIDFQDYTNTFDVIVCNPPYFDYEDPRVDKEKLRSVGRHQMSFTLKDLAYHTNRLLNENGRMYLVHRSEYINEIIKCFNEVNMEIKTLQFIHHNKDKDAHGVLLEIRKNAKPGCKVLRPILLNEEK